MYKPLKKLVFLIY